MFLVYSRRIPLHACPTPLPCVFPIPVCHSPLPGVFHFQWSPLLLCIAFCIFHPLSVSMIKATLSGCSHLYNSITTKRGWRRWRTNYIAVSEFGIKRRRINYIASFGVWHKARHRLPLTSVLHLKSSSVYHRRHRIGG